MSRNTALRWRELHWNRPLDPARALELIRRLATDSTSPPIVLEVRADARGLRYYVAAPPTPLIGLQRLLTAQLPGTELTAVDPKTETDAETSAPARRPVVRARQLSASTRHRALRGDDPEASTRAVLTALSAVQGEELLVVQLVLGPRRVPLAIPTQSPSSVVAPWWFVLSHGNGGVIDGEKRTALRNKVGDHGFACAVRVGVSAATAARRAQLADGVVSALRTTETAGLQLRLVSARARDVLDGRRPRLRWPLRLNAAEVLALTAWPFGDSDLPGLAPIHPRRLPPVPGTLTTVPTRGRRVIAAATAPGVRGLLAQSAHDALRGTHVMAPTGAGKSVLLGRLVEQDIAAGRAVVVIEPKGDLITDVLSRVPEQRRRDFVILDPASDVPVGLNPLVAPGRAPEVIADGLLSVFRAIYADAWGPRLQDVLHASLLTLTRRGDTSLVMLPLLLTNTGFRRSITKTINDPIALGPFWAWYEALSEAERAAVIAPLMNKLRPWLFSPRLRAVLGQREPRFDLREVFTERRILLVPLRSGVIGQDVARLLGSLVVAQLWQLFQARANLDPRRRHPVMVYIDEVQDYLHLPTNLGDALAQIRGLGGALTLAHQGLHQLPPEMRAAVLTNARSRILFQLAHDDAVVMAKGHPEISPEDFTSLGAFELYTSLHSAGQVTPYAAGRSLPPGPATSDPHQLRARSRARYGRPLDEVEAGFAELLNPTATGSAGKATGRRRRGDRP